MAKSTIDAYSPCPGGTGKKIKFCCNDLLGDLQKIDTMLQSDQAAACLTHIDELLKTHPDRACLLAIRGLVLRALNNFDEAAEHARRFVESHPDNQVAQAEMAIIAANTEGARVAMEHLQRAMEIGEGQVQTRVYEALGVTAHAMIREGYWSSARALLQMQSILQPEAEAPSRLLMQLFSSARIPLLLRDEPRWLPLPNDASWTPQLQQALQVEQAGLWRKTEPLLAQLAGEQGNEPVVWQQLARVRGELADQPGQCEALRKFAALDVPWDDAVEAEAIAMMLSEDPLGDRVEVGNLRWNVGDVAKLEEALAFDRRTISVPLNPAEWTDEQGPPPKSVYWLLSRAEPGEQEELSPESIPRMLGQLMVFGRQTDREARLELLGISQAQRDAAEAILREIAADALSGQGEHEVVAHVSGSQELLQVQWWPPSGADPEQLNQAVEQYQQDALLKAWPEHPLGALDGHTPRQAAADESLRRRADAAILVLQAMTERVTDTFDFNRLREELGLPKSGPIDPQETPIEQLPVIRYDRVMVERLDKEALAHGFQKASVFRNPAAMRLFARAIVDRDDMAGTDEQLRAYTTLGQLETDPQRVVEIYQQGRAAADAAGHSHVSFDLAELSLGFSRGDAQQVTRLIDHIQRDHMDEPGVREALTRMLVQFGVLRPDGTPGPAVTQARQAQAAAEAEGEAAGAGTGFPPAAQPAPGKLWTPDGGGTDDAGGGKLWTPD